MWPSRERETQIMFETINVPAMDVAIPAVLSFYASDARRASWWMLVTANALCVARGLRMTSSGIAVLAGYVSEQTSVQMKVAGFQCLESDCPAWDVFMNFFCALTFCVRSTSLNVVLLVPPGFLQCFQRVSCCSSDEHLTSLFCAANIVRCQLHLSDTCTL